MHEKSDFHWTTEAEEAFKQMKQLIAELLMLTTPMKKEVLIVYLAATKETVSAVLMTKREAKQMPIYFVSRALRGPELNCTSMEKLVLALVHASKRLKRPEKDSSDTPIEEEGELPEPWILFTDESSCTDGSGAGLILTNPKGMEFTYSLRFRFDATNNEAEYEALIAGLWIAEQIEILAVVVEEGDTWMTPLFKYLVEGTLPADVKKARAIRRKSWRFAVINETLYKKSFLGPWLRCVGPLQANYVLREIHEGSCSMHAGTRTIMVKALRPGYYWPTMHKDARTLIRACQDCQVHKPVLRNSQQKLTPITSLWPFYNNGDTPFSLTYETEAVIPAKIGMPTLRTVEVDLVRNNEAMEIKLDLLEEKREEAAIRKAKSKAKIEKYYNSKVRNTSFKPGDLVYRNNDERRAKYTGKLGPKWEGPYESSPKEPTMSFLALRSLMTVVIGKVRRMERKSTKSLPASANNTRCSFLSIRSFRLTFEEAIDACITTRLVGFRPYLGCEKYEQFTIPEEESIDIAFARFNTIISSLKALDEERLRMVKGKREQSRSLALKAEKESGDEESSTSDSEDEEYALAVRDFKKCGDPNHLIRECPKSPRSKNHKAFVGGTWSDSGEDERDKTKDETCLVVQTSNEDGDDCLLKDTSSMKREVTDLFRERFKWG
uniref:Reverse transcriptase domain-containing protein n=1 Tax=Tanacetum cinerariifolium TaxID=118510 RepID=A0A6L2JT58_TANCI|nr:reverse transcriptase domain-containing protein [Tanacetum cinerariifolium]